MPDINTGHIIAGVLAVLLAGFVMDMFSDLPLVSNARRGFGA